MRRGDTLSRIAQQYKPADVTLEQMLVAMFNANTGAFEGNNMNRLRAGAIVTVPDAETAKATRRPKPARRARAGRRLALYRDRVAGAAPSAEGGGAREAGGRIGTAVERRAPAGAPGRDQVRVSREAGTAAAAARPRKTRHAEQQLAEANSRIAELEKA